VSPRLLSSGDAEGEGVPSVAMDKIPFATDDVAGPPLSTSTLKSAPGAEGVPYVGIQKGPVRIGDASTTSSNVKVANLVQ